MSSIERAMEKLGRSSARKGAGSPGSESRPEAESEPGGAGVVADEIRGEDGQDSRALDFNALAELGFLTPDRGQGRAPEEYRIIKRPLLINAFGKGAARLARGNLIMMLSAMPGEGKTFTTLNLAMSMAGELDTTVLVVDADVVQPSLTELLGLRNRPGLIDRLVDKSVGLNDIIVSTNVPKLRIIPAGQGHGHSTELLASEEMRRLTEELSTRYADRVVLFDAPPLLATTQAHALSDLMGQIVLVVEAGRTPQRAVQEVVSQLDADKLIGIVLNKSEGGLGGDYYRDYYGSYG